MDFDPRTQTITCPYLRQAIGDLRFMIKGPVPLSSGDTVRLSGAGAIAWPGTVWTCIVWPGAMVAPGTVCIDIADTGAIAGAGIVWTGMSIDCIEPSGIFTSRFICSIIIFCQSLPEGRARFHSRSGCREPRSGKEQLTYSAGRERGLVGWGSPGVWGGPVRSSSLPSRLLPCGVLGFVLPAGQFSRLKLVRVTGLQAGSAGWGRDMECNSRNLIPFQLVD